MQKHHIDLLGPLWYHMILDYPRLVSIFTSGLANGSSIVVHGQCALLEVIGPSMFAQVQVGVLYMGALIVEGSH